jgi:hypothetical protein
MGSRAGRFPGGIDARKNPGPIPPETTKALMVT